VESQENVDRLADDFGAGHAAFFPHLGQDAEFSLGYVNYRSHGIDPHEVISDNVIR
jgi:hypothetical protein